MSTSRTMPGGRIDKATLEKGPSGRALCRWCNLEVPPGRLTFCSDWCVGEWRLRTDPGYLREQVFRRDRGICVLCALDTHAAWIELKRSRGALRQRLLAKWGLQRLTRKTLWDADHRVPVSEGGGECDLDNLRTLCLICHRVETAALRRRRALFPPRAHEAKAQSALEVVSDIPVFTTIIGNCLNFRWTDRRDGDF